MQALFDFAQKRTAQILFYTEPWAFPISVTESWFGFFEYNFCVFTFHRVNVIFYVVKCNLILIWSIYSLTRPILRNQKIKVWPILYIFWKLSSISFRLSFKSFLLFEKAKRNLFQ